MKRKNPGCCAFQGLRQKAMYYRAQHGSPHTSWTCFGKEKSTQSLSLFCYGVSHRNISCQHLNENCASNCGAAVGNCIPAMTPEGKTQPCTPAYNANSTKAVKPQGRLAFLQY